MVNENCTGLLAGVLRSEASSVTMPHGGRALVLHLVTRKMATDQAWERPYTNAMGTLSRTFLREKPSLCDGTNYARAVLCDRYIFNRKLLPLDHFTTTSDTSIRCSFGSVTVSESVSPGRMGRSPESLQPVQERFQIAPWPWNGPALFGTRKNRGTGYFSVASRLLSSVP
jgi:hypothetical protein